MTWTCRSDVDTALCASYFPACFSRARPPDAQRDPVGWLWRREFYRWGNRAIAVWSKVPMSQSCEVAQTGKSKGLQSESEIDPHRLKHLNVWSQAVTLSGEVGPSSSKGISWGWTFSLPVWSLLPIVRRCQRVKSLMVMELPSSIPLTPLPPQSIAGSWQVHHQPYTPLEEDATSSRYWTTGGCGQVINKWELSPSSFPHASFTPRCLCNRRARPRCKLAILSDRNLGFGFIIGWPTIQSQRVEMQIKRMFWVFLKSFSEA